MVDKRGLKEDLAGSEDAGEDGGGGVGGGAGDPGEEPWGVEMMGTDEKIGNGLKEFGDTEIRKEMPAIS